MHRLRAISILFALAPLFAGVAAADEKKPAASKPAPVSNQPETTTATFGQWTLRCVRRADVNNNQKICEIDAAVAPQNQPNTIFRIGVAHPLGEDKAQLRITVAVPPIVFIPTAPVIKAKPDEPGVPLTWRQCFGGACFAEAVVPPAEIEVWRAVEADTGRIQFSPMPNRNIAVQFSLRGFAQALDALDKVKP